LSIALIVALLISLGCLDVSGIRPGRFDKKMLDTLVLEPHIKKMIQSLTKTYIKGLEADEARQRNLNDAEQSMNHVEPEESSWSADFIKGKGEGLIFLLHGKPGVGKTYTAGMSQSPNLDCSKCSHMQQSVSLPTQNVPF
jgi:hypothetical protein